MWKGFPAHGAQARQGEESRLNSAQQGRDSPTPSSPLRLAEGDRERSGHMNRNLVQIFLIDGGCVST